MRTPCLCWIALGRSWRPWQPRIIFWWRLRQRGPWPTCATSCQPYLIPCPTKLTKNCFNLQSTHALMQTRYIYPRQNKSLRNVLQVKYNGVRALGNLLGSVGANQLSKLTTFFGVSFTQCFSIYLSIDISDGLVQQGLEAMAHCISGCSAKVSHVNLNDVTRKTAVGRMASLFKITLLSPFLVNKFFVDDLCNSSHVCGNVFVPRRFLLYGKTLLRWCFV